MAEPSAGRGDVGGAGAKPSASMQVRRAQRYAAAALRASGGDADAALEQPGVMEGLRVVSHMQPLQPGGRGVAHGFATSLAALARTCATLRRPALPVVELTRETRRSDQRPPPGGRGGGGGVQQPQQDHRYRARVWLRGDCLAQDWGHWGDGPLPIECIVLRQAAIIADLRAAAAKGDAGEGPSEDSADGGPIELDGEGEAADEEGDAAEECALEQGPEGAGADAESEEFLDPEPAPAEAGEAKPDGLFATVAAFDSWPGHAAASAAAVPQEEAAGPPRRKRPRKEWRQWGPEDAVPEDMELGSDEEEASVCLLAAAGAAAAAAAADEAEPPTADDIEAAEETLQSVLPDFTRGDFRWRREGAMHQIAAARRRGAEATAAQLEWAVSVLRRYDRRQDPDSAPSLGAVVHSAIDVDDEDMCTDEALAAAGAAALVLARHTAADHLRYRVQVAVSVAAVLSGCAAVGAVVQEVANRRASEVTALWYSSLRYTPCARGPLPPRPASIRAACAAALAAAAAALRLLVRNVVSAAGAAAAVAALSCSHGGSLLDPAEMVRVLSRGHGRRYGGWYKLHTGAEPAGAAEGGEASPPQLVNGMPLWRKENAAGEARWLFSTPPPDARWALTTETADFSTGRGQFIAPLPHRGSPPDHCNWGWLWTSGERPAEDPDFCVLSAAESSAEPDEAQEEEVKRWVEWPWAGPPPAPLLTAGAWPLGTPVEVLTPRLRYPELSLRAAVELRGSRRPVAALESDIEVPAGSCAVVAALLPPDDKGETPHAVVLDEAPQGAAAGRRYTAVFAAAALQPRLWSGLPAKVSNPWHRYSVNRSWLRAVTVPRIDDWASRDAVCSKRAARGRIVLWVPRVGGAEWEQAALLRLDPAVKGGKHTYCIMAPQGLAPHSGDDAPVRPQTAPIPGIPILRPALKPQSRIPTAAPVPQAAQGWQAGRGGVGAPTPPPGFTATGEKRKGDGTAPPASRPRNAPGRGEGIPVPASVQTRTGTRAYPVGVAQGAPKNWEGAYKLA